MKIAIAEDDGAIRASIRGGPAAGADAAVDEVIGLSGPAALRSALDDPRLRILIIDRTSPRWANLDLDLDRRIHPRDPAAPYVYLIVVVDPGADAERSARDRAGADAVVAKSPDLGDLRERLAVARRIAAHEEALRGRSDELERVRVRLERENAALSEIASSDALTGLRNRRFFREALDAQFSLARRKGLPISLVMIDVDEFKAFNDRFGHPAGDDVLREVGRLLRGAVRDHDIVARYGGEEFAILLPATEAEDCGFLVDRLRQTIARHGWTLRPITISLGVATLGPREADPDELIDQADRALYFSKALGRNRTTHSREIHGLATRPIHAPMDGDPVLRPVIVIP